MESLAGLLHPPACHSEPPTDLPGRCSPGSLFGVGQRKPLESRSPKANHARPPARTCWDKAGVGKRGLYLVCFDLQEAHVLCLFFFLCKHCLTRMGSMKNAFILVSKGKQRRQMGLQFRREG